MNNLEIDSIAAPLCFSCQMPGKLLYEQLPDRIFSVPGNWNIFKCSSVKCGSIWINPKPVDSDLWKLYINYFTHEDSSPRSNRIHRIQDALIEGHLYSKYGYRKKYTRPIIRFFSKLIYLFPGRRSDWESRVFYTKEHIGGSFLEIGFGSGDALRRMSEFGWKAEGIDFDKVAVSNAKKKGLIVYCGHLADQGFHESVYDIIAMSHVIEHVADPTRLLIECNRLLKPGGRLIVITPNAQSFLHFLFRGKWMQLDPPRHLRLYTKTSLYSAINNANLNIIKCVSTARGTRWAYWGSISIARNGKFDNANKNHVPFYVRIVGEILEMTTSFLLLFIKYIGEDIVVIAEKKK
jgi:2-polyprenyl-3-methyl-5-hydroxy-6-metoxy-1,4-benzoquinol methylase